MRRPSAAIIRREQRGRCVLPHTAPFALRAPARIRSVSTLSNRPAYGASGSSTLPHRTRRTARAALRVECFTRGPHHGMALL
ncbi:hypothetical protein Bcep1808_4776 [Burkholderia vietnamiensis G4]|uniref:Uncharacterized protein n=1 Tax=Burkholderia vietnamiensis (strain G4 / LMG 22486) TaxID=269482 RepID=A4JN80_BURVG|nr:hypothetical protein Bcep1808_4776 [Burkholderia vietnamiensis G4]